MRGRSSSLITLSSSPSPVPPIEAFSANFYLISWPFTQFFGLLPVFWVTHDTPRYLCYMIAEDFGFLKHLSFPPTSAQISTLIKKKIAKFFFPKKKRWNFGFLQKVFDIWVANKVQTKKSKVQMVFRVWKFSDLCKRSSIFGLLIRYKCSKKPGIWVANKVQTRFCPILRYK